MMHLILVIHLKRFDEYGNETNKINDFIQFDEFLKISKYMSKETNIGYNLFGVAVHSGKVQMGVIITIILKLTATNGIIAVML